MRPHRAKQQGVPRTDRLTDETQRRFPRTVRGEAAYLRALFATPDREHDSRSASQSMTPWGGPSMTEALAPRFDVSVERLTATAVVRVRGELDIATVPALTDVLRSLEQPCDRVVLDLSGLTFIDSTGLTLAVTEHQRAAKDGVEFVLAGATGNVLKVFRLTGLDVTMPMAPDLASALADGHRAPGT
jgi:anti-sigma B factor antagonist